MPGTVSEAESAGDAEVSKHITEAAHTELAPPEPIETQEPARHQEHQPIASPTAITDAIEQVNDIIKTLRETLDEMEEVLETLELAERQKTADEREIESLRRALGHLRRPRNEGH
jgi:predicted RNase H-like nuclease (RuvC/YqgF family)